MTLDFEDRLLDYLESMKLPFTVVADSNIVDESISLVSMPGSKTIQTYYDGVKDKRFTYFVQLKTKDTNREVALNTLESISSALGDLEELASDNGSYEFISLEITNEPYYFQATEDGDIYFRFSFQVVLTIY